MDLSPTHEPATRTVVVRRFAEFLALQPQWDPLLEASENGVVFARWDWIRIWLEVFETPEASLAIICVWRGNALIGLAPLWIQARQKFGLKIRTLRFLGTGEAEQDEVLPEMLDVICRRADADLVACAVAAALTAGLQWDTAVFDHVLQGSVFESGVLPRLGHLTPATGGKNGTRYCLQWQPGEVPRLTAPVEYKRRKLRRKGTVQYQCVTDLSGWEAAFEVLKNLHTKRWRERGIPGVFASPQFTRFHRKLAQCWCAQGGMQIHLLHLEGRPVAALYNLCWRGVEYFYQCGVDVHLKGQSAGVALHAFAIERAAHGRSIAYDFLGGEAHSYKGAFGAPPEPLLGWSLARQTWRGRLGRRLQRNG